MTQLHPVPKPHLNFWLRHISADLGAPDVQFVWDQEDGKNEAQDRYQRLAAGSPLAVWVCFNDFNGLF